MPSATPEIVQRLLDAGRVTMEQVNEAEERSARQGTPVLNCLIQAGVISDVDAIRVAAEAAGTEFVELADYVVDPAAVMKLSGENARRYMVMPLAMEGKQLVAAVALSAASNVTLRDDLTRLVGCKMRLVVAVSADIAAKIASVYRSEGELGEIASEMVDEAQADDDLSGLGDATDDAPIVRFVNILISQAIGDRASDIHIEPTETHLVVRERIDGVLREMMTQPVSMARRVVSRLKILSNINIAETRIPQDGRMSIMHNGAKIDLRVATIPTVWGLERVTLRILDNSAVNLSLSELGFAEHNFNTFQKSYTKPYGMILVTGPTGSGKSTTLYATLNIVARPEVNVITIEDPVEYRIKGINQIQVNTQSGMTFPAALRAILRSDPDIVLIGEIRDFETAQIAVEAALTGHLVLSTLHTNDAPSAVTRLTEMGIEPFLVGSALDSVLAQRLCRRLCLKCKEPYQPTPEELTLVGYPWEPGTEVPTLYRPGQCNQCSGTGYRGRMALHEVMPITEEIERLAVARASSMEIGRHAVSTGMRTLRQDGWLKVSQGFTSIEEILRVVA